MRISIRDIVASKCTILLYTLSLLLTLFIPIVRNQIVPGDSGSEILAHHNVATPAEKHQPQQQPPPDLLPQDGPNQASMVSKPAPFKANIDKQKPIIVQYQFDDSLDCNGAYLKLMKSNSQFSSHQRGDSTNKRPYSVMFGVDKCGVDAKLHFIMQYLNPKTNQYEEKHWKSAQQVSGLMQLPSELGENYGGEPLIEHHPTLSLYESNLIATSDSNTDLKPSSAIQNHLEGEGICALTQHLNDLSSGRVMPNRYLPSAPSYSSEDSSTQTDSRSYYQQQFISTSDQDTFPTILNAMRHYWMEVSALCLVTGLLMNYILAVIKRRFNSTRQTGPPVDIGVDSQSSGTISESVVNSGLSQDSKRSIIGGPIVHDDGVIQIGKITFDPKLHLGHGCRGTCVFKGTFESKQVCAVKRVLSQYVTLAGREIEFLRSLQHENLVRYLATEEDAQFIYIALELAELTLADLMESDRDCNISDLGISKEELCRQSALGLNHLHKLNIVHRDIKPQNILISFPLAPNNERKVMISDFGISKQLPSTNVATYTSSVSRSLDGTQGWLAPEIVNAKLEEGKNLSPAKSADIFALGCVFYYIYSEGGHPFGNLLDRQVNILKGEFELRMSGNQTGSQGGAHSSSGGDSLPSPASNRTGVWCSKLEDDNEVLAKHLIESMISKEVSDRPPIEAVMCYPLFWTKSRRLQFLLDVSDRIEKEENSSEIVLRIECARSDVVDHDWKSRLSKDLEDDLRKFRSYSEYSVRHLLRAIRNKKNHYYELPDDLKGSLGDIPDQYTDYFTTRFPRLLPHVYIAVQMANHESVFRPYYASERRFTSKRSSNSDDADAASGGDAAENFKWADLRRSWRERGLFTKSVRPKRGAK